MKTKLEAVANITVIVVALVVGGAVLSRYLTANRAPRQVAAGDRLATIPGVEWKQHRTLLLVLNTGCHFCQDSVPFYQKLAEAQRPGENDLDMVAVFPNEAEMVNEFIAHEKLPIRSVPAISLENLRVNATPTLILVNREGRVERSWVGVLTARQEVDLLKIASGS
jgi:hypothetical protein